MKMNMLGRYFFALVLLGCLALQVLQVHAQDQSGFISLDCGLASDFKNYTESTTGINYMSDAAFIETGIGKNILPEFQEGSEEQLWHVRSFPNGTRNCYRFNLTKGSKYLIRAYFMYGNYDELGSIPQFDLYIGPNKWATISLENTSFVLIRELLHVLPLNYLHVCLVNTGSGTPFISALEIRPNFTSTVYKTETGSLNLFARLDFASTTNRKIRYKDDVYDRIWRPYNSDGWAQLTTNLTVDAESSNDYRLPSIVMQNAVTPENASAPLDFFLDIDDSTVQFYVYMHFAELRKLQANESRQFNITLRGENWYGPFSPNYLSTTTVYSTSPITGGNYTFSIRRTENSTLPPILNAIEVYSLRYFNQSETNQKDVDAITNIKSTYSLRNWQGDPCVPQAYMWDGLNCSINSNASIPPRIISLNLSSFGLNGKIPPYLENLTSLQSLDLSHNNFAGSVPDFLSELPLTVLDLSHNNFTGSVPDFLSVLPLTVLNLAGNNFSGSVPIGLLDRSKNGTLKLSVDGNPNLCPSTSCKKKNNNTVVPVVASVVGFVVLVAAALAIFLFLRRRKQQDGKMETECNSKIASEIQSNNRQFLYSEVLRMTNNYERILGKGGFGKVFYGRLDGNEVAVKMLSSESVYALKQFQAEVQLLMRVHHRNLTSLLGYCDDGDKMALIYEYMANGNLLEHLSGSSENVLSWEVRLRIAVESAQGLEYLHNGCKPPIVHRDVKSNNILLNEKFQAKLGDFGLSKSFANEAHTHVTTVVAGTHGYVDPEYFRTNKLTEKSDVYSFGVVLLEIITSRPVIARTNEHEKTHVKDWVRSLLSNGDIKAIVDPRLQGTFDTNTVWKAVEVAMACLSPTGHGRPTMSKIVMELSECLASEMARTNPGNGFDSKDSVDHIISMNLGSELNPSAR